MKYRVYIGEPGGFEDPFHQHVDIYVTVEGGYAAGRSLLNAKGTAFPVEEGVVPDGPTLRLPAEALPALFAAVESMKGYPMNAVTEASVLREWLAVEMARVSKVLERHG